MPVFKIPFKHTVYEYYTATIEADDLKTAMNELRENPFDYASDNPDESEGYDVEYYEWDAEEIKDEQPKN